MHPRRKLFWFLLAFIWGVTLVILGLYFRVQWKTKHAVVVQTERNRTIMKNFEALVERPLSDAQFREMSKDAENLDLPYTICYFPIQTDPTRWVDTAGDPNASSSIVRQTRPFAIEGGCPPNATTEIAFDLRTDASTINEAFVKNVDDILQMILQNIYPGIQVERSSIIKNLTYQPTTQTHFLSVVAVYRKTDGVYAALINQFKVSSSGTLVNDPVQSLTAVRGIFNQIHQQGKIFVLNATTRILLISAKSSATNTLRLFGNEAAPKEFTNLLSVLELDQTESRYAWIMLPDYATVSKIYFVTSGPGTVQISTLLQCNFSVTGIPTGYNLLQENTNLTSLTAASSVTVNIRFA
jgi:hypothetical protein